MELSSSGARPRSVLLANNCGKSMIPISRQFVAFFDFVGSFSVGNSCEPTALLSWYSWRVFQIEFLVRRDTLGFGGVFLGESRLVDVSVLF